MLEDTPAVTSQSRYAVPLDTLNGVHVNAEDQVLTRTADVQPVDAARWGGSLEPAYGDSAAGGGGGQGACDGGGE